MTLRSSVGFDFMIRLIDLKEERKPPLGLFLAVLKWKPYLLSLWGFFSCLIAWDNITIGVVTVHGGILVFFEF